MEPYRVMEPYLIKSGPPEGILSRLNDMFEEKEKATHIRAAEFMRELHWGATDMPCQPKDSHGVMGALQCHGASPCYGSLGM